MPIYILSFNTPLFTTHSLVNNAHTSQTLTHPSPPPPHTHTYTINPHQSPNTTSPIFIPTHTHKPSSEVRCRPEVRDCAVCSVHAGSGHQAVGVGEMGGQFKQRPKMFSKIVSVA